MNPRLVNLIRAALALLFAASAHAIPPAPLKSADGCFVVAADGSGLESRAAVLNFAEGVRAELRRATGWELKPGYNPILIALDCTDIGEMRHQVFFSKEGAIRAQIEIPATKDLDASRLATEVVSALARIELARHTPQGRKPSDFPEWFLIGLTRQLDPSVRQSDFEHAWSRWSRGRLEPLAILCGDGGQGNIVASTASQVVAWLLDQPSSKQGCAALLKRLGDGAAFDSALALACFADGMDPVDADEAWDFWMAARSAMVLEPGTTPPNATKRFRATLLAQPRDYGIRAPLGVEFAPEDLLRHTDSRIARAVAARKSRDVATAAIGRDRAFKEMAALFSSAFDAIARGDAEAAASALSAARRRQRILEAAASAGETL